MSQSPNPAREKRRSVLIASAVLLIGLIGVGIYAWWTLSDSGMSAIGGIVLAVGILVTLGLGIGLMSLVYFSNRVGYDDEVGH